VHRGSAREVLSNAVGIVTSPANGQLFTGLTTQTAITAAGTNG
jgi:hypothetical protein